MKPSPPLLNNLVSIAQRAGDAIMAVYSTDFSVETKADESPLTRADQAAHELIVSELKKLAPEIPILSEEDTDIPGRAEWGSGKYWLVDPLDGTKEFIKRNGEFTVNIALIEQGRAVMGVVHAPALGVTYAASTNEGAFKLAEGSADQWQRIEVARHDGKTPWRVVGSRSHADDSLTEFMSRLGECELVSMGSSLKLCLVAEGAADIYPRLGPTSLWDTAAAQCVVEAAGGKVIQLDGSPLSYANTEQLLNPFFLVHGISKTNWPSLF
ncbi:3'(2'),5'-bisphosphate nucleotidase CysQ [Halothiobacillus neapolitanus]|uniref:3'(2'),5'-bisphosphate nucleotidase CysQ n=1 Tax=Halothiobacillus neapolitanus (strain ATCC 23641 / DSM 15147 / CIP 104769 / NCIMB 8539 / c2) TaxID=555778 RepID=D0L0V9_HALNC|nr:3'(2'),5'-bisphosphate nucleotidase CysQ [Halothiobacillus neapolitanus]ACX96332.1 3'(2'),5'-bisphosphate nucleotidase [Halothiobacillus neapolitanus c2]TDN66645.1 3'(2'),5'-bisphosphate nucleotidase [Halothiobacillus neapolitanus]